MLPASQPDQRSWFFLILNMITLSGVVFGFGPSFLWRDTATLGPQTPILIIHGVVFTGWYILILLQADFIRRARLTLHKTLGSFSLLLAVSMLITGHEVAAYAYKTGTTAGPLNREGFQFLPFSDLLIFTVLYGLGFINRHTSDYHKRYMVLASISMLLPALGRLATNVGLPGEIGLAALIVLALSIAAYDWLSKKQIIRATLIGLSLIFIKIAVTLPVGQSENWASLVRWYYGG